MMQGTKQQHRLGYDWMRVGFATPRFKAAVLVPFVCTVLLLAFWTYLALPAGDWRWRVLRFAGLYCAAALLYVNAGVWVHEQLHCLPYRGPAYRERTHIYYARKYLVALTGWYRVTGPLGYRILRRALLGPMLLVIGWVALAWISSLFLPGWVVPVLLTLAAMSLMDMVHDLYWLVQVRSIGELGKYWDNGHELEVVWKPLPPAQVPGI